jgi:hypothetical protein
MGLYRLKHKIAAGAVSVGLAAMMAGTTVSPAAAATASPGTLPAACDSVSKSLAAHSSIQSAVKADRNTFIGFTCVDDLVTVEAKGKAGPAKATVVKKATGKPVDLTGLSPKVMAEKAPAIILGPTAITPEPIPSASKSLVQLQSTTINHSYRASSNNTIYWGSRTTAGVLIWSSSARVTSWISLQKTNHPFNVTYISLGNREIDMIVPVRMREHFPLWPDGTVDTQFFSPFYYGRSYSYTSALQTPNRAGKFFPELYNMSLYDRAAGRSFAIGGNIQYPRFQCYATANCKYPYGVEAPW